PWQLAQINGVPKTIKGKSLIKADLDFSERIGIGKHVCRPRWSAFTHYRRVSNRALQAQLSCRKNRGALMIFVAPSGSDQVRGIADTKRHYRVIRHDLPATTRLELPENARQEGLARESASTPEGVDRPLVSAFGPSLR